MTVDWDAETAPAQYAVVLSTGERIGEVCRTPSGRWAGRFRGRPVVGLAFGSKRLREPPGVIEVNGPDGMARRIEAMWLDEMRPRMERIEASG